MKKLLSFDEFVNENYNKVDEDIAPNFKPDEASDADVVVDTITAKEDLIPGKESIVVVDGEEVPSMVYQGVTDHYHIFNTENMEKDVRWEDAEMDDVLAGGAIKRSAM